MKGILLAGGHGSRLYPLTAVSSKQLVALYNKPLVYYPLTTMMLAGIREILVVTTPGDVDSFRALLRDGSQWGVSIEYATQPEPKGIAQALIIGSGFVGADPVMLILGDNLIYGNLDFLRDAIAQRAETDAVIFAYRVSNPEDYGVVDFDESGRAVSLEEKPTNPSSRWAVPGLYIYPPGVADLATTLAPSARGEIEITDLNSRYLEQGKLMVRTMPRGIAWLDTGTPHSLLLAANFIEAVETRQGLIIGSPEESALRMRFLGADELLRWVSTIPASSYRTYLEGLCIEVGLGL